MVEHTRRRRYQHDRILIESDRVLTAQFDDAIVYLSGAQLEMLRNVSQYLRNLNTYVSEYQPGYYLTPDASDYDDILAIVSDLEETLMGNPNTIWGYKANYEYYDQWTIPSGGDKNMFTGNVPVGDLWCLDSVYALNDATACTLVELIAQYPAQEIILHSQANPGINERVQWDGYVTLSEGCRVLTRWYGCTTSDVLRLIVRGHTMTVPEE